MKIPVIALEMQQPWRCVALIFLQEKTLPFSCKQCSQLCPWDLPQCWRQGHCLLGWPLANDRARILAPGNSCSIQDSSDGQFSLQSSLRVSRGQKTLEYQVPCSTGRAGVALFTKAIRNVLVRGPPASLRSSREALPLCSPHPHPSMPCLLSLPNPSSTTCHDNSGTSALSHVGHWFLLGATLVQG